MKKKSCAAFVLGFCLITCGMTGFGQESVNPLPGKFNEAVSWGLEADFNSKYLWRGITCNDGLIIQPNLWVEYKNLSVEFWGSITAYDRYHSTLRHEMDLLLSYNWRLGNLEIDHSVMFYYYPGQDDAPPTGEAYLGLSYPVAGFFVLSNVTADFLRYQGSLYFEHGLAYEHGVSDNLVVGCSAILGWANRKFYQTYIAEIETSVNMISLNADITFTNKSMFYFKPHIQISRVLDKRLIPFLGTYPWFCGILMGIEL
jgi:hypothetical protein